MQHLNKIMLSKKQLI